MRGMRGAQRPTRAAGFVLTHLASRVETVEKRHLAIHQHEIERVGEHVGDAFDSIAGDRDGSAELAELVLGDAAGDGIVLDNQ